MEDLLPADPEAIGPYGLLARLGRGPKGVVYLGEREGGLAAVKLLHAGFGGAHWLRTRFAQELAAAQRVEDPGVARVLGAGLERGVPWVASEYVRGLSLRDVVEGAGPRTGPPLDRLAIGTAGALWAMHRAGVIHRDLGPGNVLLDSGGPRVIDFGYGPALDAVGGRGMPGGPAFRAPEQVSGAEIGSAVDVWGWACLVAYAATGRPPFGGGPAAEVVERILHGEPDLAGFEGLDGRLRHLVEDCLAKSPRERPSAQRLLLELNGTTAPSARSWPSLPVMRVPPRRPQPKVEPIHPHLGLNGMPTMPLRPLLVAASAMILVVFGGAVVTWNDDRQEVVTQQAAAASQAAPVELNGPYRIKALRGGTSGTRAFIEYELANTARRPVTLETPGELLIRSEALPAAVRARCQPVRGMCALRTGTVVVDRLKDTPVPGVGENGSLTMPPKARYVLRVSTAESVGAELAQHDLGLYVLDPKFSEKALTLPFKRVKRASE
ncbi:serine/threonine protein kinase [Actinocorallia populi]|uniref:serine/threonine protein kinase n=1 Tax=Actinocorallia populi TaxID=2079200 RepID=UPI000D08AB8C|nr:serine/threonine-protein kinase [Actinocorallia populi]